MLYGISLPFLSILSFKKKYHHSLKRRFFLFDNPRPQPHKVWIHACSFGEVRSLAPLVALIHEPFLLTVITQTGYQEAKRLYPQAHVAYLPFELFLPFWAPRHALLIVTEAELWHILFWKSKRLGAETLLINARLSDRSFPRYQKMGFLYRAIFSNIDRIYTQSARDTERFVSIGATRVSTGVNLKLLLVPEVTRHYTKSEKLVILGASTHEGEEELILRAFGSLPCAVLILAPRHPERFAFVRELAKAKALEMKKSFALFGEREDFSDIMVLDRLGDLINLYAISDIVVLGGAFIPAGGHNPLEPAYFGCKLISGIHVFNQIPLFEMIEGYKLIESDLLESTLSTHELLPNSSIKERRGAVELLETLRTHLHKGR